MPPYTPSQQPTTEKHCLSVGFIFKQTPVALIFPPEIHTNPQTGRTIHARTNTNVNRFAFALEHSWNTGRKDQKVCNQNMAYRASKHAWECANARGRRHRLHEVWISPSAGEMNRSHQTWGEVINNAEHNTIQHNKISGADMTRACCTKIRYNFFCLSQFKICASLK